MILQRKGFKLYSILQRRRINSQLKHDRFKSSKRVDIVKYCMDNVKKHDYENYLCTLLLPDSARGPAFVLRAFNIELAQIRDVVSSDTIGKMRFQFWREVIEDVYQGKAKDSPLPAGLLKSVELHNLTKRWLLRLIESREENLSVKPFPSLEAVEEYTENSNSSLNYLILEALGFRDLNADHAASHSGKAQGITNLLRAIPHTAKHHRTVLLPIDLMIKYSVSQEDIVTGSKEQKVKDLIYDVASSANAHLEKARSFTTNVPDLAKPALLTNVCVESWLKLLQKADFDIFHPHLQHRNGWLPLQLWLKKRKKLY